MNRLQKIVHFIGGCWLLEKLEWIIRTDSDYFHATYEPQPPKGATHE